MPEVHEHGHCAAHAFRMLEGNSPRPQLSSSSWFLFLSPASLHFHSCRAVLASGSRKQSLKRVRLAPTVLMTSCGLCTCCPVIKMRDTLLSCSRQSLEPYSNLLFVCFWFRLAGWLAVFWDRVFLFIPVSNSWSSWLNLPSARIISVCWYSWYFFSFLSFLPRPHPCQASIVPLNYIRGPLILILTLTSTFCLVHWGDKDKRT